MTAVRALDLALFLCLPTALINKRLCVGTEDEALNRSGSYYGFSKDRVTVLYLIEAAVENRTHYLSKQDQHLDEVHAQVYPPYAVSRN